DVGAVLAAALFDGADDNRLGDVALLDRRPGDRVLDRHHDDIAEPPVTAMMTPEHLDALGALGAGVVGDGHHGSKLDPESASRSPTGLVGRPRRTATACPWTSGASP